MFDSIFKFVGTTPKELKPLLFFFILTLPINYSILYVIMNDFSGYGIVDSIVFTLAFCIAEMFICFNSRIVTFSKEDDPYFTFSFVSFAAITTAAIIFFLIYLVANMFASAAAAIVIAPFKALYTAIYGASFIMSLLMYWGMNNRKNNPRNTSQKNESKQ